MYEVAEVGIDLGAARVARQILETNVLVYEGVVRRPGSAVVDFEDSMHTGCSALAVVCYVLVGSVVK